MSTFAVPETHRCWELTGAGLENLSLVERPVPQPGPGELLVRIDACGICFSDIKILNLGGNHPRLLGRDLKSTPVVMGHETAMTVVQVGEEVRGKFHEGQRFLIQADVYKNGEGMAFGYRLPGGYSQYQVISEPILDGDEGCYLLPISEKVTASQAALCEPWACVEAAYRFEPRREPLSGGRILMLLLETEEIADISDELKGQKNVETLTPFHSPWLREPDRIDEGIAALREEYPEGFDDILVYGAPQPALLRGLQSLLRVGGVLAVQGSEFIGKTAMDIGSIHYRGHWLTGSPAGRIYAWDRTTELKPGGIAWFIGAGGPLGQMHLQRALSLAEPPSKIIVSQNGGPRLEDLRRRFAGLAKERQVEFVLLDSRELGDGVYERVREETCGHGCDDIIVVIPNAAVVERAFEVLAPGGGMDIFAGVAVGTTATLDADLITEKGVRLWGTSGSSIADLQSIVDKVESGQLPTERVVAAVGGLEAVKSGLEAVRDGVFLGKTVIYPHLRDLPLQEVSDLAEQHPSLREKLLDGRYWTPEAEAELLRLYGG